MFSRFRLRLISFQLKLLQPVEQVQPKAGQPLADSAEAVKSRNTVVYVYVLRSLKNKKRYVGYTRKTPLEKLAEHNSGATQWTRQNGPFVLLHVEEFAESAAARKRERFLKLGKGRQWLDQILPGSSAGRAGSARGGSAFG